MAVNLADPDYANAVSEEFAGKSSSPDSAAKKSCAG